MSRRSYLLHLQFLGFRYHGWAKQPNLKTVHGMLDKTLAFIFQHENFKTLGASRTDALVSANHFVAALYVDFSVQPDTLLLDLNLNLPPDIRALKVEAAPEGFNILQSPRVKEYHYVFAFGGKGHPFAVPLLYCDPGTLDFVRMKIGARIFEGVHNFRSYCAKPAANTIFEREILHSEIVRNNLYVSNFNPAVTFLYRVRAKGFLRNQVRLMMGALLALGRGEISPEELRATLAQPGEKPVRWIAPASGLVLHKVEF